VDARVLAARFVFGHVPDRLGGAKVALICVLIEAAGLALIWLAPDRVLAAAGSALTGFGYSLVYPGLAVEAVRRAPPQSRGLAMGSYTVFLDVALGFGSPGLGLVASWVGLGSVFLAAMLTVLGTVIVAVRLLNHQPRVQGADKSGLHPYTRSDAHERVRRAPIAAASPFPQTQTESWDNKPSMEERDQLAQKT
jgi:MFS family permease